MDWIVIDSIPPYDGRYQLDLAGDQFTTREWGWVKRLAGYLPGNLEDGLTGMDPELICAFATIALHRAGKVQARDVPDVFERITDAPFGSTIRLETDRAEIGQEEDADPPSPPSSSGNGSSSGPGSTKSSETSPATPARSGIPALDTSGSA